MILTVVVLALGGLIAACGSSSNTTTSGTTASAAAAGTGPPNASRRAALAACLKQHGVTLPARPPGTGGGPPSGSGGSGSGTGTNGTATTPRRGFFGGGAFANNPKLRAAFQACGARFGFGGGQGFRGRLSRVNITRFVTCVRQHGYNLPKPNFSGRGPVFPAKIRNNAQFQAASRPCQSLLAPPRPSSGTSTTSGA